MKALIERLKKLLRPSKGFTLIELLVVIAVLGILAAGVLVAIDPIEQLNRGRDAGRKSSVAQLGRAAQAYFTTNSAWPAVATWNTDLTSAGEIKVFPTGGYSTPAGSCTGGTAVNNFCYKTSATDIVIYTHMESNSEQNKGTCGGVAVNTWYVYSTKYGKAGTVCQAAQPDTVGPYTFY